MLMQSLPLHSTIGRLRDLCAGFREDCDDLSEMMVPASLVIFDVMKAIGIPDNALALVLTSRELNTIGDPFEEDPSQNPVKCQFCGEEAEHMVKVRGAWMLVCESCEGKIQHS